MLHFYCFVFTYTCTVKPDLILLLLLFKGHLNISNKYIKALIFCEQTIVNEYQNERNLLILKGQHFV